MAKVEQFPDQSGENGITEETKDRKTREIPEVTDDQKTRVMPEEIRDPEGSRMPDDSLLMGRDARKPSEEPREEEKKEEDTGNEDAPSRKKGRIFHFDRFWPGSREDGQDLSYEEQIRRHRDRIRSFRLFAAVIAVIAVLLAALFFSNRHYNRAEISKIRDFVAEEGAVCVNFDGYVLQYGPNGATCADTKGRVNWSITYEMDQPIISMSGDVAAIADYGGTTIYVMNTKKQLYTVSTSLPIHKVAASESREVAAVLDDKSKTWIRLYSKEGREIAYFIRSMQENGYPMDVAVSPDGKTVCVSSLLMKDAEVISNLSFYNFGKEGQKKADHRVDRYDFIDEVVPYVGYMDDETCAGISDKRLILFQKTLLGKSGSSSILFSENLQGVFSGENLIGLLFNNTSDGEQYRLDVYNRRGRKAGSVKFTMQYKEIKIAGDKIYINNDQECQIFDLSGRCIFKGNLGRTISALIPGTGLNDLLVVTGGEIDSVRLH